MEKSKNPIDLVYFGYDTPGEESETAQKEEKEFMETLKERFPSVTFKDAYDEIKGFRREVFLDDELKEQYFTWIFGWGWHHYSLMLTIMMSNIDGSNEAEKYIDMAILEISDEERKKISEQHKQLEKVAREKKEELKIGLKKPEEKKKTTE
jgi:hypothetical protein